MVQESQVRVLLINKALASAGGQQAGCERAGRVWRSGSTPNAGFGGVRAVAVAAGVDVDAKAGVVDANTSKMVESAEIRQSINQ